MKRKIKLTESKLKDIINESVKRVVTEAENYGWVVDSSEAQEAYDMAVEYMGKETIDDAIIRCLTSDQLAECLAYIFRMYDFREWSER
jgi:hypothetical protein